VLSLLTCADGHMGRTNVPSHRRYILLYRWVLRWCEFSVPAADCLCPYSLDAVQLAYAADESSGVAMRPIPESVRTVLSVFKRAEIGRWAAGGTFCSAAWRTVRSAA